ncbi:MAG TPA: PIN domain-containing protein [Nevskiaceae bacterium]|nr:PIN domain-containing protein [Nevskiaceae bacterium]
MKVILVDSDVLFALNSKDDANFEKACQISRELVKEGFEFTISNFVLAEAVTLLSYRISHQKAVDFFQKLIRDKFPIIRVDNNLENRAYQIFKKQISKNVSVVDCINIAILEKYNWNTIFSFDKIYKKNGFELVEK